MSPCERHHFAQTGTSARIGPLALRHVGDQVGGGVDGHDPTRTLDR